MPERVTPLMLGLTFTTRSPWASTMRTTLIDRRFGASSTSFLGSTTLQAPVAAPVYKFFFMSNARKRGSDHDNAWPS